MKLIFTLIFSQIVFATVVGKVTYIKGQVSIDGKIIEKGSEVKKGEVISTADKSLAIIKLHDKSIIKLDKNTSMKINSVLSDNSATDISLYEGASFFNVLKHKQFKKIRKEWKNKSRFNINTKAAAMGVRGTIFFVAVTKKNKNYDTWLCVNEGKVEAQRLENKASVFVKKGEGLKISQYEKMEEPKPLPWTGGLNWNFDEDKNLENKIDIKDAYSDILDQDYD